MTNPFNSARRCAYATFAAGTRLALGLFALGALACAKGGDAPPAGDTALAAAETTATVPAAPATNAVSTAPTDSVTPSPTTKEGAEQQKSRAATPTSEAARLDSATRASARAGAKTRDTARTGAVTPAPVTRKTATNAATTKTGAGGTTSSPTATATRTTTTPPAAKTDSTPSAPAATSSAATTGGGAGAAPAGGQQSASAQSDDKLTASPAAYQGWKTFHVYCYRCHGTDAMGSDLAPNLRHSVGPQGSVTHEVFVTTVKEGRLPKGMPAWKAILTDEQIENLYAYLKARSNGSLAAGRPRQAKSE